MEIRKKPLLSALTLLLAVTLLMTPGVAGVTAGAADAPSIEITVNGIPLETEVAPYIMSGSTYVPLRAIAEALGCKVDYNDETKDIIITNTGITLEMKLNSPDVLVNSEPRSMAVYPMNVSGRTMVPVRFVSETFDSLVIWQEGYGDTPSLVIVCSKFPTQAGDFKISSEFREYSKYYGETPNTFQYAVPQISGMSNAAGQEEINKAFSDNMTGNVGLIEEYIKDIEGGQEPYEISSYSYYDVSFEPDGLMTVTQSGYMYTGGAHGYPIMDIFTIDVAEQKLLKLGDLFKSGSDFQKVLTDKIEAMIARDIGKDEGRYSGVFEPELPEGSIAADMVTFWLDDDSITIYFYPYDIASYADGFVEFDIPKSELADILADKYK